MKRRSFLKSTLSVGATGMAVSAGLITPGIVMANSHGGGGEGGDMAAMDELFKANKADAVMDALGKDAEESDSIAIKAPEIAENGAVVPITISSNLEGATSIAMVIPNNPTPLAAVFNLGEGAIADVSTRLKMGKTSDVVALVKAGDKTYMAKQEVKVTIGGCGG
ncbi:MAG: thiosulfate oxidation carrier protein SoxY [Thiolinea sp.]